MINQHNNNITMIKKSDYCLFNALVKFSKIMEETLKMPFLLYKTMSNNT